MDLDYLIASDCGNSEQIMIMNGNMVRQPTAISKVSGIPFIEDNSDESAVENLFSKIVISLNSNTVSPGIYYVGEMAIDGSESYQNIMIGTEKKFGSEIPIIMNIGIIAAQAVKDAFAKNQNLDDTIKVTADLVTGLPLTEYVVEHANEFADRFTNDVFDVRVHLGRNKFVKVELTFDFVKVYPESSPVVFSLTTDRDGNERSPEFFEEFIADYKLESIGAEYFLNKRMLHIDIGEGTTEFPITDGLEPNQKLVRGSYNGIGYAIEEILAPFADKIAVPSIQRNNVSAIVKDSRLKYHKLVKTLLETSLEKQAEEIVRQAIRQMNNVKNDLDVVVVYGGGSILLKPFLYDKLKKVCSDKEIMLFYIPEKYATTLYVEGLNNILNSEIFEYQKKMLKKA